MKNRLRDNRGYTLVELMAVLVIFAILLAIAGGGIAAYQKHSAFKKNNEYAQTIFTALQSSMAHAKAGGSLDELSKELSGSEYKDNRLNGKMIDGGTALGVCYSDKAKSFYYGNTQPKGGEGSADISGRSRNDRYDRLVGYYGVDSVSSTPEPMEGSVFKSLELVNKETLSIRWELEDASQVNEKSPDYDGTYSIRRLGFSAGPMYARMQASGTGYRPSQWEQTNTEHSYFAKEEAKKDGTKIYDLTNPRHLFNLRFEEKDAPDDTVLYRQAGDIFWNGEKGMAAGGFLFEKTKQLSETEEGNPFPSASKLNKKHTLQGMDENDQSFSVQSFKFGAKNQKTPAGLFEVNEGTIRNMVLKQISSQGTDYVGTVCGVNYGSLKNISVDKKSTVKGKKFVGGITGSDITGNPLDTGMEKLILVGSMRTYDSLKNSARVEGEKFVGGVVGYLNGICIEDPSKPEDVQNLSVKECENYGYVTGTGQCIGGIVGYNRLSSIEKGLSVPVLTKEEEEKLKEAAKNYQLKGDFVGGIVGLNDDGIITKCSTGKKDEKSFVAGYLSAAGHIDGSGHRHTVSGDECHGEDIEHEPGPGCGRYSDGKSLRGSGKLHRPGTDRQRK